MSDDLRCDKHPERRVPCFLCVSKSLDEWPLSKSGMTATECLALIEKDRTEMRDEIDRLMGVVGDAMTEIETLRTQLAQARERVLRPLSAAEVEAALHEGRAEAMAATGDNAWTSLLRQRDEARAEVEKMRKVYEAAVAWRRKPPTTRERALFSDEADRRLVLAVDASTKSKP